VTTGSVAVIDASPRPVLADDAELVVGIGARVEGSASANGVLIKSEGVVTGEVRPRFRCSRRERRT
jgi:hypothetical protein